MNEDKTQTDPRTLLFPRCLSFYYNDWEGNHSGCLVYDNSKLCVIDTPWRMDDDNLVIPLHNSERELVKQSQVVLAKGILADIFTIILINIRQEDYISGSNSLALAYLNTMQPSKSELLIPWLEALPHINFSLNEKTNEIIYCAFDNTASTIEKFWRKDLPAIPPIDLNNIYFHNTYIPGLFDDENKKVTIGFIKPSPYNAYSASSDLPFYLLKTYEHWAQIDDPDFDYGQITLQMGGFCAFIVNYALKAQKLISMTEEDYCGYLYLRNTHSKEEFASLFNVEYVQKLLDEVEDEDELIIEDDSALDFVFPEYYSMSLDFNKQQLFETYINILIPSWKEIVSKSPIFPLAFSTNENLVYSLLLYAEKVFLQYSSNSLLWQIIDMREQEVLTKYAKGLMAFLSKEYGANTSLIDSILAEEDITIYDLLINLPLIIKDPPKADNPCNESTSISLDPLVKKDTDSKIKDKLYNELSPLIHENAPAKVCDVLLEYKEHLAISLKLAPTIYDELKEIYEKLGFTKDSFCRAMNRKSKQK